MFGWLFKKKDSEDFEQLENKTRKSFESVKGDIEKVGTLVKHLDEQDKQLFDMLNGLKIDLSSIRDEVEGLKEAVALVDFEAKNKQVFKKTAVLAKQGAVYAVQNPVQTAVQTGNLYDILHNLSSNERLLVITLMNAGEDMKLSYEDLARLLGKERSTIRGQINAIKQKSEGLILELTEPNGKKRVYVSEEVRIKLQKYAKVRVTSTGKKKKNKKKQQEMEKSEGFDE